MKVMVIEIKHYQLKNILKIPYFKDIINDLRKSDTQKTQLKIAINFMFFNDNDEERVMHSKSDDIEITTNYKTKNFQSLLSRYQIGFETSMKSSDFIIDCVYLSYYKYRKINPKRGRSYIDSPDWMRNKKQQ